MEDLLYYSIGTSSGSGSVNGKVGSENSSEGYGIGDRESTVTRRTSLSDGMDLDESSELKIKGTEHRWYKKFVSFFGLLHCSSKSHRTLSVSEVLNGGYVRRSVFG